VLVQLAISVVAAQQRPSQRAGGGDDGGGDRRLKSPLRIVDSGRKHFCSGGHRNRCVNGDQAARRFGLVSCTGIPFSNSCPS